MVSLPKESEPASFIVKALRQAIESKFGNVETFYKKTGIDKSRVSRLLNMRRRLDWDLYYSILKGLDISEESLFKSPRNLPTGATPAPDLQSLNVLGKSPANLNVAFTPSKEFELVESTYDPDEHYCLKVHGRSMYPTIYEGDTVVVKQHEISLAEYDEVEGPSRPEPWLSLHRRIVVVSVNGEDPPQIKRMYVYRRTDTGFKIILHGDNRSQEPIDISEKDTISIKGVVVRIIRDPMNFD